MDFSSQFHLFLISLTTPGYAASNIIITMKIIFFYFDFEQTTLPTMKNLIFLEYIFSNEIVARPLSHVKQYAAEIIFN